ncbi:hypothetical protein FOA52_014783 [Chlamydomonas sp. UWO 241]|nr:hypothetical protein FOA52_014783 [Chlamydomonas sp. UWO 241]
MILPADFDAELPTFALTGGEVKTVSAFKYLGSWITQSGGVEKEIGVRVGRALGVFDSRGVRSGCPSGAGPSTTAVK